MAEARKNNLRVPPQNLEAEKALLGSIMLRPEALPEIMDIIRSEAFYADKHSRIFDAMLALYGKSEPIDLLTLSTRLKETGQLDLIGGTSYLTELVNLVPSSANAEFYADIVLNKHILRRLIEASEHISSLGYNESHSIEDLLDQAEKRIFDVTHSKGSSDYVSMGDALGEAWERLEKLHRDKGEIRGVPTGFKELDNKLAGLQKSDLIILAARPSMGKTSFALDIARNAAVRHNVPVAIFSLEMSSQQLVDRMIAAESRVDAWKLRTGKLSLENDFEKIRESLAPLSNAPIFVDDNSTNNIMKMRAVVRRLKADKKLGLVVVDYLQLMAPVQSKNSDNVVQQVTEISRSLKQLAREFDVPVLALSQLSRAVESRGGRPRLSDLRDSGAIEQDADVVLFIHRERDESGEKARASMAEILIEKHRNGPTGKIDLFFDQDKSTFLSVDKNNFSDFDAGGGDMGAF